MVTKEERDAWTAAYRLYEEYAAVLRESEGEAASDVFVKVLERIRLQWEESTEEGRLILLAGYDLLDEVWKASHNRKEGI